MGRLIDADAFKKFIKEKYKDGESTDDIKDQILFDLSYQPTAYDPEKVVIELDKSSFLMDQEKKDIMQIMECFWMKQLRLSEMVVRNDY